MNGPSPADAPLSPDFLSELFHNPLDPGYADAAPRRSGWRRSAQRAVSLLALVAVGFLLAVAYRQVVSQEPSRAQVRAELVAQVQQRRAETDGLRERADELRNEVNRLRDAALADTEASQLREQEAATGLARVRGDGVVVRLVDGPPTVDPVTGGPAVDPNARILDRDLQQVTNALWATGAEALAVNGQRLTATSTIRNAGDAIMVDYRPVNAPYEVSAIGPDAMATGFDNSDTGRLMRLLVDEYGIGYDLRSEQDLTLPAASAPQLRYAVPERATATSSGGTD